MSSKVAPGLSADGVKRDRHPVWYPPTATDGTGLRVANSLTDTVEPFAPRQGRLVRWYTCGPTVYDVAHMGHARAYLTFDILRRVMEDYFGYEVQYQMNITDIDDKIIKRARINKLLEDYRKELGGDVALLKTGVAKAVEFGRGKMDSTAAKLAVPLPESATTRVRNEREEKLEELKLKTKQFNETVALLEKNASADFNAQWDIADSLLGDMLDVERGASITDQAIFEAHARHFERTFFDDMARLGVREPDLISRVTEYVPQVVTFVEKIIANGFAYVGESSVFFDTDAFTKAGHDYAKLKGGSDSATTEAEMAEGEGTLTKNVDGEKRSANDFALWKFSKPGEPAWPSPWGPGRPGWHIECSVMASDIFGDNMDIHAGGWDLKFPHHDNECAQSEAFHCNHQWVNYFFHCGHLHIDGLKMSKSLKNFITIRQALDDRGVTPRAMRLLFLETPWNAMMSFSDQSIQTAEERDRVLRAFFGSLDAVFRQDYLASTQGATELDRTLLNKISETQATVHTALCNNFDFPTAFTSIMALVSHINQYLLVEEQRPNVTLLKKAGRYITRILRTFGVIQGGNDVGYVNNAESGDSTRFNLVVDTLVAFRDEVRANARATKEMSFMGLCDKVRDESLIPAGVRIEDKPGNAPSTWKNDEPELLQREADERKAAIEMERVRKINNQVEVKKKLVQKWEGFFVDPMNLFTTQKEKYSAFDEATGVPTKDAAGAEIPEKARKKLVNEMEKYKSGFGEFQQKGGAPWLDGIRKEISDLTSQLQK